MLRQSARLADGLDPAQAGDVFPGEDVKKFLTCNFRTDMRSGMLDQLASYNKGQASVEGQGQGQGQGRTEG